MTSSAFDQPMPNSVSPPPLKRLPARICWAITQQFLKPPLNKFNLRNRALGGRFESHENYVADRVSNVEVYRQLFSEFTSFQNKTVLELGCSSGYLINAFKETETFSAIGADIDSSAIARARKQHGNVADWVLTTPTTIPISSNSVDVIYTVDTVEHLSRPSEIFLDAYRVLRPGGVFLIHFCPWFSPNGSHLEDIIPFPWAHVVFSMDTLLDVAANLYESKEYSPACYWYDQETGYRRPNPYLDKQYWREFLNDLSVRKFKRHIRRLPFETVELRKLGFGGKAYRAGKYVSWLAQFPLLDEMFIKAVFCVLRKPALAN